RVLVQDSGPGIPPQELAELMRPFRQLDGSFSRPHQGMGIGLATCNAIARLLHGQLSLRNRPSGGLEVDFVFPVQFADAPVLSTPAPAAENAQRNRSGVVMVVEDNLVNLLVLKGYLKHMGYSVLGARNGQQALDLMQSRLIDLVLMDCQMPVMDGFEATRRIRRLPEPLCATPIVALTANAMEADRQKCFQTGMNGFLKKPVEMDEVRTVVASHLAAKVA